MAHLAFQIYKFSMLTNFQRSVYCHLFPHVPKVDVSLSHNLILYCFLCRFYKLQKISFYDFAPAFISLTARLILWNQRHLI